MTKIVQSIGHLQAILSRPQSRFDAMPLKRVVRCASQEKESSRATAMRRSASRRAANAYPDKPLHGRLLKFV
jgi:hypothetical protein